MYISVEKKIVLQDYRPTAIYEAIEEKSGLRALGGTHFQAFSNLLGLLEINNVPIYNK